MSEPLTTGIKRIIWIASDKKHRVVSVWHNNNVESFKHWKSRFDARYYYITKHEVWL